MAAHKEIRFARTAKKTLAKLEKSNPVAARTVNRHIGILENAPDPLAVPDVAALRGKKPGHLRFDAGNFRIIFRTNGDSLLITDIGPRNDFSVYRKFNRA